MSDRTPAVVCQGLVVRYGDVTAVDGLDLTAEAGRVLAVLGPNGAGKTSTVETLEGYRRRSAGEVSVLGLDPATDHRALVGRIGVMLQRGGIHPTMGARQALHLFARYYQRPEDPDRLLEQVALTGVARTPWRRLSGGEQQRLALALALVGRPEVLFLDEPTSGVDPEGRVAIRAVVAERRDAGCCVVLTTHELAEAERMADDVVIVHGGRVLARGRPDELSSAVPSVRFRAPTGLDMAELAGVAGVARGAVSEPDPGSYRVEAPDTAAAVAAIAGWLAHRGLPVTDLRAGADSLEDTYLRLTAAAGSEPTPPDRAGRSARQRHRPGRRQRQPRPEASRRWRGRHHGPHRTDDRAGGPHP